MWNYDNTDNKFDDGNNSKILTNILPFYSMLFLSVILIDNEWIGVIFPLILS